MHTGDGGGGLGAQRPHSNTFRRLSTTVAHSSALVALVEAGELAQVKRELERDGSAVVAVTGEGDESLLQVAAAKGHTALCTLLLDHAAEVNACAADGSTPLHSAVFASSPAVASLLLQRGADPNLPNHDGATPLHLAAFHGLISLTQSLLSHSGLLSLLVLGVSVCSSLVL
jgi:uncharacterized protein